jgi:hypothetical protein
VLLPTDRLDTQVARAEGQRAACYTRESDRLLGLGSAWLTRWLVVTPLDVPPLEAQIALDGHGRAKVHGRPAVGTTTNDGEAVHVSAPHSKVLVCVAISTSGMVDVDVAGPAGPAGPPTRRLANPLSRALEGPTARLIDITTWTRPRVTRWPSGDPNAESRSSTSALDSVRSRRSR